MSDLPDIDKGIPIPPSHKMSGIVGYLKGFEIGDSATFPVVSRSSVSSAMRTVADRGDKEFTSRKVSETKLRVWRVK